MRSFLLVTLLTLTGPIHAEQGPQPPNNLVATSATKSAVVLAWTAPDPSVSTFVVDRKPLGTSWTPPPPPAVSPIVTTPVTGVTMTDGTVGQFATYVYRVRVASAGNPAGAASNEITVGPPPVGFSSVLAEPKVITSSQFARGLSAALDANGDPAVAYLHFDLDNNSDNADSELRFISWNRAKYRWNAPVTVAVTGDTETNTPRYGISLAADPGTGRFAIAHMTGTRNVKVALSNDGVTWNDLSVVMAPEDSDFGGTSVAIDKERVYLAYAGDEATIVFVSGLLTDPPDKWKSAKAPLLPGTFNARRAGLQVALDDAGKPAVLYWLNPESGYNVTLALWRPETNAVVKVADTNGEQSDGVDARIAFNGPRAVVAFHARRDKEYFDNKHQAWVTSSSDNGATWNAPVPLPADGGNSVGIPISLAVDSQGTPAVVAWMDGGNDGGKKCGEPKLFRQNAGVWTVCAPDTKGSPTRGAIVPNVLFAANRKLYIAFTAEGTDGALKPGVLLWRER